MIRAAWLLPLLAAFVALSPQIAEAKGPVLLAAAATVEGRVMNALAAKALQKAGMKAELSPAPDGGPVADLVADLAAGRAHAALNFDAATDAGALSAAIGAGTVRSLGGRADNARGAARQKIVWGGMKKRFARAQKLLKRMVMTDKALAPLVAAVTGGASPAEAVDDWWGANRKTWSPWVAASKNWMKP